MRNEDLKRDQLVFEKGQESDKFYIVARGTIEISTTGQFDEKLRLALLGPGDYFGESSLLENRTRNATAMALTDCELLTVAKEDFEMVEVG